ncbi:hypothetical protein ACRAWF_12305 [Streptomyces sp. L7]
MATVSATLLFMAAQFTVYGIAGAYLKDRFDAASGLISVDPARLRRHRRPRATPPQPEDRRTARRGPAPWASPSSDSPRDSPIARVRPALPMPGWCSSRSWAFFSASSTRLPQQARLVELVPPAAGVDPRPEHAAALYLGTGSSAAPSAARCRPAWAAGGPSRLPRCTAASSSSPRRPMCCPSGRPRRRASAERPPPRPVHRVG